MAAEKLGLPQPFGPVSAPDAHTPHVTIPPVDPAHAPATLPLAGRAQDIKSFIEAKNPRSDIQLAATVAYYYQFEAPPSERKDSIDGNALQDACRKAGRDRFQHPGQTLRNAHNLGLLDKTGEAGHFSVNTVGENLVAMTLPGDGNLGGNSAKRTKKKVAKPSVKNKRPKQSIARKAAPLQKTNNA